MVVGKSGDLLFVQKPGKLFLVKAKHGLSCDGALTKVLQDDVNLGWTDMTRGQNQEGLRLQESAKIRIW